MRPTIAGTAVTGDFIVAVPKTPATNAPDSITRATVARAAANAGLAVVQEAPTDLRNAARFAAEHADAFARAGVVGVAFDRS